MNTFLTFGVIFVAVCLALILGAIAYRLAPKLGLVDDPGSAPHKVHMHLTPLAGGIVLLITIGVVAALVGSLIQQPIWAILVPAAVIFGFGLWDDYKNISPIRKFAGQLIATLLLIYFGVQMAVAGNPRNPITAATSQSPGGRDGTAAGCILYSFGGSMPRRCCTK